jgi:hypothetical protein
MNRDAIFIVAISDFYVPISYIKATRLSLLITKRPNNQLSAVKYYYDVSEKVLLSSEAT